MWWPSMQFEILWMLRPDSCCFSIQPGKLPLAFSFYLFIYFHFFFMFVHVMRFCVWVWTQISSLETKMEMILRHQARIIHAHTVHSWISTHTHPRAHTDTQFPSLRDSMCCSLYAGCKRITVTGPPNPNNKYFSCLRRLFSFIASAGEIVYALKHLGEMLLQSEKKIWVEHRGKVWKEGEK